MNIDNLVIMKAAIPQHKHSLVQAPQQMEAAHAIASMTEPKPGINDNMGAALGQVHYLDLGKGTGPAC